MAKTPKKIKAPSLTGRITSGLVLKAWKAVKRNRGAAGIDKVSVAMFAANLDQNLNALMRDLKDGSFEPLPLRRQYIPKSKTEFRPLGRVFAAGERGSLPHGAVLLRGLRETGRRRIV